MSGMNVWSCGKCLKPWRMICQALQFSLGLCTNTQPGLSQFQSIPSSESFTLKNLHPAQLSITQPAFEARHAAAAAPSVGRALGSTPWKKRCMMTTQDGSPPIISTSGSRLVDSIEIIYTNKMQQNKNCWNTAEFRIVCLYFIYIYIDAHICTTLTSARACSSTIVL